MRLKDIAAVTAHPHNQSLQGTNIRWRQSAAHCFDGFIITIISGDWTSMLRAAGVAVIVLIYCYPFKSAWQRTVNQLAPPPE
jgi:hypothetical protein